MQYKFPRYPTRCALCDRPFEIEEELLSVIFPADTVGIVAGADLEGVTSVADTRVEGAAATGPGGRELATVGEEKQAFVRQDYCLACATEPPEGAYSEWRTTMPSPRDEERVVKIDTGVVFDFFQRLAEKNDPEQCGYVYFLGLYLMRKRKLKFLDSLERGEDEVWVLESRPEGVRYEIIDPRLDPEALESIRQEIMDALSAGEMEL